MMKDKVKNNRLVYLIIILVVLLLICIGDNVYKYVKNNKKKVTYLSTFENTKEEAVVEIKPDEEEQKNKETVQEKEYKSLSDIDINIFTFKDETLTLEKSGRQPETVNIVGKISKQELDDYLIKYRGYSISYFTTTEPDYIVLTESSFYIETEGFYFKHGDEDNYRCYGIMYLFSEDGNGYLRPVRDGKPDNNWNTHYGNPYFMSYDKKYILEADYYDESHGYLITYDQAVKYGVIEDKKGYSFS